MSASDRDYEIYRRIKLRLFDFAKQVSEQRNLTSLEIGAKSREWIDGLYNGRSQSTPKYLRGQLTEYFDALNDALIKPQTVFLYCVDGEFYSVKGNTDYPSWDTLPRDMWGSLGGKGGIYWKKTTKPYFVKN